MKMKYVTYELTSDANVPAIIRIGINGTASTDCNIPLSMGIPAVCIGVYEGGGSHTREEWLNKAFLKRGLEIAIRTAERITDVL